MANTTPNLIKIGQSNIKNPKKIVDTHDTNMEKMKVYLTKLSVPTPAPVSDTFYEDGVADYGTAGVEFILIQAYTEMPVISLQLIVDANDNGDVGAELDATTPQLVPVLRKENFLIDGVSTPCYSRVTIYVRGSIPATIASGKITMTAVCRGKVIKA